MSRAFESLTVGRWQLPQRFVMAPLTRNRAGAGHAPTELNAEYYGQRAGAGLIVTEGVAPSQVGQGYLNVPGLYTDEQVAGWRLVADAVHADGGVVVAQLMHVGRIAHADNKDGVETVAPSAVQAPGEMVTADGSKPHDVPRAVATDEVAGLVADFVTAARNAVAAGLDGVEVHAANGYLLHQFLDPTINLRDDVYGGSPENRARFVVEVVTAVAEAIGADRVGLRLSPGHQFNGIGEELGPDLTATYRAVVDGVAPLGLAYLSLLASPLEPLESLVRDLRERFDGVLFLNDGFGDLTTLDSVEKLLGTGLADAVVVGRQFLANPDLVERWRKGADLNEPDPSTVLRRRRRGLHRLPDARAAPESSSRSVRPRRHPAPRRRPPSRTPRGTGRRRSARRPRTPRPPLDSASAAPSESAMDSAEELKPRSRSVDCLQHRHPEARVGEAHPGPGEDVRRRRQDGGRAQAGVEHGDRDGEAADPDQHHATCRPASRDGARRGRRAAPAAGWRSPT